MTIENCINSAVSQGAIDRKTAQELLDIYRQQLEFEKLAGAGAEWRAAQTLADELEFEAMNRKRKAGLSARAARDRLAEIQNFTNPKGERDVGEGLVQLLEGFRSGFESVEGLRKAIISEGQRRMDKVIEKFDRSKIKGTTRNKANLEQVTDELFGKDTGSVEARQLANAWMEMSEWLRQRFNAAGGAIGKMENWGLPQYHDGLAMLNGGKSKWKETILPRLDLARMKHPKSGRPISPDEIGAVLDEVYETVTTQGWNKKDPQMQAFGKGALAGRHGDPRFLIFKDGTSWLEYQREFGGGGDAFEAMMSHLSVMARDIAAMEKLGPNPDAMLQFLKQHIQKEAALKSTGKPALFAGKPASALSRANGKMRLVDNMWADMRGAINTPVASGPANFMANLRNTIVGAKLGGAVISAVTTDPFFQLLSRKYAGLSITSFPRDIARAMKQSGRSEALRSGLILDSVMNVFGTQARYLDNLQGSRLTQHIADRVLQLSGLTPWTQAARHAFGFEFIGKTADLAETNYAKLPDNYRQTLRDYGIDGAMWNRIRGARIYEPESGAMFMRPKEVIEIDQEAGERYLQMILQETEFAVPSSTVRGRAAFLGGNRPGTLQGEAIRSGVMFKGFSMTVMLLHGVRIHRELTGGGKAKGAAYAGSLLATATMGGAMAIWLKDIVAGRDPRPVGDEPSKFILQSMLQGGGLGIFGDFIVADRNRYGGGLASTLTGPAISTANDFLNLTVGNALQVVNGEETKFGKEALELGAGIIPGSNVWYLGLAYQRMAVDQAQKLVDPAANKSFKSRQKFWKRKTGSNYWWKPGSALP